MVLNLMHVVVFCYQMVVGLAKMFAAGMRSLVYIDNKKIGILVLCEGSIDGLYDTELAAEKEYATNFTHSNFAHQCC